MKNAPVKTRFTVLLLHAIVDTKSTRLFTGLWLQELKQHSKRFVWNEIVEVALVKLIHPCDDVSFTLPDSIHLRSLSKSWTQKEKERKIHSHFNLVSLSKTLNVIVQPSSTSTKKATSENNTRTPNYYFFFIPKDFSLLCLSSLFHLPHFVVWMLLTFFPFGTVELSWNGMNDFWMRDFLLVIEKSW